MAADKLPTFWATTIAKVLSGDQPCPLQPWLSGRMKFPKRDDESGALAAWKARHTDLLRVTTAKMRAEGWRVSVEQFFRVEGKFAALSGKADLIVQPKTLGSARPKILDAKGGDPKDSDVMQVIIGMVMVPLSWGKDVQFDGEVVYADHVVAVTHAQAMAVAPQIFSTLKLLGTDARPDPLPGKSACQWCPVPESECSARWVETPAEKTDLF